MSAKPSYIAEEAARLKAAYKARKKVDPSLTQDKIADHFNWSGQSAVSQYLNGRIPLNLTALMGFASLLKFRPSDVSPRLVEPGSSLDKIVPTDEWHTAQAESLPDASAVRHPAMGPVEAWDDGTPLGPDEVEIPFFKEVELAAGLGSTVRIENHGRKLRFGKRTLQSKQIQPCQAACVTVAGNSMEPVLPDGCTVAVDTGATAIQDGKMYAIDHAGQLRVKLLYSLPGGGLRIRSYNDEEYPDERYEASYVREHIRIIGKVFWYAVLL
ncbi:helix-turn-helix transcriptional regulator [Pseudomonas aeruginosa]|nr:helix-turn-helix transcriptional regulator [Pseudomonas aeruginosa]